jgi:hypothetical protein
VETIGPPAIFTIILAHPEQVIVIIKNVVAMANIVLGVARRFIVFTFMLGF